MKKNKKSALTAWMAVIAAAVFIAAAVYGLRACSDTQAAMVSAEVSDTDDGGVGEDISAETDASESTEQVSSNFENTVTGDAVSGNDAVNYEADSDGALTEAGGTVSGNDVSGNGTGPDALEDAETEDQQKNRVRVKGIYVTGAMAGTSNIDNLIDLVDRTELNAMVIDVKNDDGRVVYEMNTPMVSEIGSSKRLVKDMPALIQKCREKDIYLIARIVAFKDPFLAEARNDLALHDQEGNLFRDRSGLAWVNPYKTEVWDYLLEIAEEAAAIGFDEIQFDYIRFATEKGMASVDFGPEAAGKSKEEIITEFTIYAAERLHALDVPVSADVYGIVIDSQLDASNVGQNYYEMSKYVDAISPMVYPSHYGPGNLGLSVPDAQPYETIYRSMSASRKVLSGYVEPVTETGTVSGNSVSVNSVSGNEGNTVSGNEVLPEPDPKTLDPAEEIRAAVRPWLQDFTATWVKGHISYGPEEIRAQIQGVYDAGYKEWILWNAANRYTEGGLLPEESQILSGDS